MATGEQICEWCRGPLPEGSRSNRLTCSKRCRQAKQRFSKHIRRASSGDEPMRFAYADPPYPGLSKRYYGDHRDFNGEVDHAELVSRLTTGGYDGWALSTSAPAAFCNWLFELLGACRGDTLDDLFPGSGAVARAWDLYASPQPGDDDSSLERHATVSVAGIPATA